MDITIDKIAPDDRKNLYFGFAELRGIGFVLGPVIMGMLLQRFDAIILNLTNIFLLLSKIWDMDGVFSVQKYTKE